MKLSRKKEFFRMITCKLTNLLICWTAWSSKIMNKKCQFRNYNLLRNKKVQTCKSGKRYKNTSFDSQRMIRNKLIQIITTKGMNML